VPGACLTPLPALDSPQLSAPGSTAGHAARRGGTTMGTLEGKVDAGITAT
jgi:hypothetical protein